MSDTFPDSTLEVLWVNWFNSSASESGEKDSSN